MFDYRILKAEKASVHKAEEGGEHTCTRHDCRQIHALLLIKKEASQKQNQSLSHVAKHRSEDKGIRQCDKCRRIKLIVSRKPVHVDIHLKRTGTA